MRSLDPNPCTAPAGRDAAAANRRGDEEGRDALEGPDAARVPAALAAAVPEALSPVGKRARARYVETVPAEPVRGATGSIAISFAIVAFRNWPRRGL